MQCKLCNSKEIYQKYSLREFDVLQCNGCGLVFLSRIPMDEELKAIYSPDYYLEREEYYFNNIIANPDNGKYDDNVEAFSWGLKKLNSLKPGRGRVLDVGCGLGTFLNMAKMDGWDACGVDVSPYAAKYAGEKFGIEVYNNAKLVQATFPSERFDIITLWDSLEHFPDPLGQFREINRILKDDGYIMLDVPNEGSLLRAMARFFYVVSRGGITYPVRKLYHTYHLYYYSPTVVETLLKKSGFEIISMDRKTIPIVKARGSSVEKGFVKLLSYFERGLNMEYELFIVAKKAKSVFCQEVRDNG